MKTNKKTEKIMKLLKDDNTYVVLTDDVGIVNGNAFEILTKIQRVLLEIVQNSRIPKEMIKEMINLAFMDEEELKEKFDKVKEEVEELLEEENEISNK